MLNGEDNNGEIFGNDFGKDINELERVLMFPENQEILMKHKKEYGGISDTQVYSNKIQ